MRRCIVLCVLLALTACSPKTFTGERAVRTASISDTSDSTALRRWLERAVSESFERHLERSFDFDAVTVRETFSDPDGAGNQHVTSSSTTHMRGRSSSTSGTVSSREEVVSEGTDSTSVAASHGEAMTEEKEKVTGAVAGWIPWYVYAIALVGALVVGIGTAILGKRFRKQLI